MTTRRPRTLEEEMGGEMGQGEGVVDGGVDGESAGGAVEPALDFSGDELDLLQRDPPSTPSPKSDASSRSSSPTSSPINAQINIHHEQTSTRDEASQAAAERFKYILCSSGILDKDFLVDRHDSVPVSAVSITDDGGPAIVDVPVPLAGGKLPTSIAATEQDVKRAWHMVVERWDIALAGVALVVGVMMVVGWKRFLGSVGALVCGIGGGAIYRSSGRQPPPADIPISPRTPLTSVETEPTSQLQAFLRTSEALDTQLRSSLSQLSCSSDLSRMKPLRTILHRTCDQLNDHLADISSTLSSLVDKAEYKVLADMYDIPASRQKVESRDWEREQEPLEMPGNGTGLVIGAIPSPRRHTVDRFFSPPSTVQPARPRSMALAPVQTSWEMGVSQTLPPTTPRSQVGHSRHLSLLPSLPVNVTSATPQSDRFTSLPRKTPRLSKRASWDPDAWRRAKQPDTDMGESSQRSAQIAIGRQLAPSAHTPKRTSPLSGRSHEMPLRPSLTEHALRMATLGSPSAPASKRSSLQARLPASANPKRRSLQSLAYFPADASDMIRTASSSTTVSDLQQARERGSDGDRYQHRPYRHSRQTSMRSDISSGSGLPFPHSPPQSLLSASFPPGPMPSALPRYPVTLGSYRPDRVTSLSPLTHPALQAACLGVHLRRRRVACELLALNWTHSSEEKREVYWREATAAVRELTDRMQAAVEVLQAACEEAKREERTVPLAPPAASYSAEPPWRASGSTLMSSQTDWAPRTTDEEQLASRIASIQVQLEAAWRSTAAAHQSLSNGPVFSDKEGLMGMMETWTELQSAIGDVSRHVGAAKTVLRDSLKVLGNGQEGAGGDTDNGPIDVVADLPDLLQGWESDSHTGRSTSIGTVLSDTHPDLAETTSSPPEAAHLALPAVGKDEVFEALIAPEADKQPSQLSALSRTERIALSRKAREMGMTLKELVQLQAESQALAVGDAGDGAEGMKGLEERLEERKRHKEAQMARSGLVLELQGMMGAIQRRKREQGNADGVEVDAAPAS